MRRLYDGLYLLGALLSGPFLLPGFLRSGKWRTDWKGRLGRIPPLPPDPRPTLLLHGVSVGEINATRKLVEALQGPEGPSVRLVVSATTNTGFARACELYGAQFPVVRFPFDLSGAVRRFLDAIRPDAVALMELEVWPNLARECRERGIPLVVLNGRLSRGSFRRYRWIRPLIRPMFRGLWGVAAQTEEYARRFRELGVPPDRVVVTDTMKWDTARLADEVPGAGELGEALGIDPARPLVVAGSTGPGEEKLLLEGRPAGVQLLLVPRKPERFEEVARLAPGMVRRSQGPGAPGAEVFLLDSMGELGKAYALADVAVVGRSFVPLGGSDPIEPVALGKATVMGPHFENFADVVTALRQAGGIRITSDPWAAVKALLADPAERKAMGERGRAVVRSRQGATRRTVDFLRRCLEERGRAARPGQGPDPEGPPPSPHPGRWGWLLGGAAALYFLAGYLTTWVARVGPLEEGFVSSPLPPLPGASLVSGVFSVHTERSHDALGTPEEVAKAAAEAGLDFVVVGDHPRDDRRPGWSFWEPRWLEGVLVEGGLELRAPGAGKVLAMGVDTTFQRWEGSYASFVEMLEREGATALVVHGRGPRRSEFWIHPSVFGLHGWEVLDLSEAARRRVRSIWGPYHLLTLAAGFGIGMGDRALLHLMREGFDTPAVRAYDSLRLAGPLTATAGLNTHPKVRLGPLLFPPYGPFFKTLVAHVSLTEPLPRGDASLARDVLAEGLRKGAVFLSVGRSRRARAFRFAAMVEGVPWAWPGEDRPAWGRPILRAGFVEAPGSAVVYRIVRNGKELAWVVGPELGWEVPLPGFYRVEVYTFQARWGNLFLGLRPWIFTGTVGLRGLGDGGR